MKCNLDELDLRAAFREEPERCHQALMDAARSVREDKQPMRKHSLKTIVIALAAALSMLTTAFAAGELLGWTDYFERWGIHTTPGMRDAMQMEPRTYQVGPLTFTVREAVADNRMAMMSTSIAPTDGSAALMTMFADDSIGAYGDRSRMLMNALGVEEPSLACYEVGAAKDIPVYSVRAIIEVAEEYSGGEGMEDILWDAQSNVSYFSQYTLKPGSIGDELPVTVFLRVAQHDANGEEIQKWMTRESLTIPVGQKLAEKTYTTDAPCTVNGAQLESIRAELYITGAYLTFSWRMPDGLGHDDEFSMWDYHSDELLLTDGAFNVFERGVSLSAWYDDCAWPVVTVEEMINVDGLPEVIRISDGTNETFYK